MTTFWLVLTITIGFTGVAYAQGKRKVPYTKVTIIIDAPIDSAFDYIVPVDLSHIFKRYNRLPAITKTNETEKWIKPGLIRTVFFEDGSTARETLLTVVPHTSFSYKIDEFTSQLRLLAKRIEGKWVFTDAGNGQTKIEWTYEITPKNFITRGLIKLVLLKDITVLLNNALTILKDDLESKQSK
jgi:Polyketide cyclase / dehydrase and lipid transport